MTRSPHMFQRSMPVLEVTDMERSVAFYRDKLGFHVSTSGEPASFVLMQRGTVSIALDQSQRERAANNQWWAAYIYVADARKVRDEFAGNGVAIHRAIEDMPYGCRDFDVMDPDGYILGFGQPLNIAADDLGPGLGPDRGRDNTATENASRP
ncbi:MAG: glyoxalase superfamily protein [Methyloligellaceae bacterium]